VSDELRAKYQFDYSQAKPNRFAATLKKGERLEVALAWYDQWPWKLVWPAIVSVITTLIVYAIKSSGSK